MKTFNFNKKIDGSYLFSIIFEQADNTKILNMKEKERRALIRETINRFIKPM